MKNLNENLERRVKNIPLYVASSYIILTIILYTISPAFDGSIYAWGACAYGLAAIFLFYVGYEYASYREWRLDSSPAAAGGVLNFIIIVMSLINLYQSVDYATSAYKLYSFNRFSDIFFDIGGNYFDKERVLNQIWDDTLGKLYATFNLLSLTQVSGFMLAGFFWRDIHWSAKMIMLSALLAELVFAIMIGTMGDAFRPIIISMAGFLAGAFRNKTFTESGLIQSISSIKIVTLILISGAFILFIFMNIALSSRVDRISITLPFLYSYESPIYWVMSQRVGDGFGLSLSYISQGWLGLSHCLKIDFVWTEGLSSSRTILSYYERIKGFEVPTPLSYPVRQEALTGYPAFANWHTIFPWLASDVTFPGALAVTALFGAAYGKVWAATIRQGCLVSASLFGLFTLGVMFMNANSQVLDDKNSALALLGLIILYPFRNVINKFALIKAKC